MRHYAVKVAKDGKNFAENLEEQLKINKISP